MPPEIERPIPAYQQIAESLRLRILNGELAQGEQLPSARELAAEWSVQPNTAMRALTLLRSEGLTTADRGKGTFVRLDEQYLGVSESAASAIERLAKVNVALKHWEDDSRPDSTQHAAIIKALSHIRAAMDQLETVVSRSS